MVLLQHKLISSLYLFQYRFLVSGHDSSLRGIRGRHEQQSRYMAIAREELFKVTDQAILPFSRHVMTLVFQSGTLFRCESRPSSNIRWKSLALEF